MRNMDIGKRSPDMYMKDCSDVNLERSKNIGRGGNCISVAGLGSYIHSFGDTLGRSPTVCTNSRLTAGPKDGKTMHVLGRGAGSPGIISILIFSNTNKCAGRQWNNSTMSEKDILVTVIVGTNQGGPYQTGICTL